MLADKPTELSRIKLKTWTRQPVPMISEHSAHYWGSSKTWTRQPVPMISEHSARLVPLSVDFRTWLWRYTCLLLLISIHTYIFVVVNFDALAQASDFRIERRQLVFLCWEQDSNPGGLWNPIFSRLNACWQTDWAIEDQAKKLEFDSPSLWSASIQPTWPHCHLAFAPGSDDIHICCC